MRIGSFHDLLWGNSFPVQAPVVEPVFTVSFVTQSMYLDIRGRILVPCVGGSCGSCGRKLGFLGKQCGVPMLHEMYCFEEVLETVFSVYLVTECALYECIVIFI
jgi:hypothetical protein